MAYRLLTSIFLTFLLIGCGEDNDSTESGTSPSEQVAAAECSADASGELCVLVKVPDDGTSTPEKVSVHFFAALPPAGPPTLLGAEISDPETLAQFVPGATVPVLIAGLPETGEMFLYGVIYMPGGGAETWRTEPGVDLHGAYSWDTPIQFSADPINLEDPISFSVFSN
jgi:hypothetical protein